MLRRKGVEASFGYAHTLALPGLAIFLHIFCSSISNISYPEVIWVFFDFLSSTDAVKITTMLLFVFALLRV
jgi:hypothetical protein